MRVNGGARLALTILSGMNAERFAGCVQAGDTAALVRLPGVAKKTAERLVVEMRDRLAGWEVPAPGAPGAPGAAAGRRKVFTLQTCDELFDDGVDKVAAFSLHAGVAARANERERLERL